MLEVIVILDEGGADIIRRVDVDALHLPRELLLQGPQGKQVVPVDQHVAGVRGTVGLLPVLHQDAGFKGPLLIFAHPGEFQLPLFDHDRNAS